MKPSKAPLKQQTLFSTLPGAQIPRLKARPIAGGNVQQQAVVAEEPAVGQQAGDAPADGGAAKENTPTAAALKARGKAKDGAGAAGMKNAKAARPPLGPAVAAAQATVPDPVPASPPKGTRHQESDKEDEQPEPAPEQLQPGAIAEPAGQQAEAHGRPPAGAHASHPKQQQQRPESRPKSRPGSQRNSLASNGGGEGGKLRTGEEIWAQNLELARKVDMLADEDDKKEGRRRKTEPSLTDKLHNAWGGMGYGDKLAKEYNLDQEDEEEAPLLRYEPPSFLAGPSTQADEADAGEVCMAAGAGGQQQQTDTRSARRGAGPTGRGRGARGGKGTVATIEEAAEEADGGTARKGGAAARTGAAQKLPDAAVEEGAGATASGAPAEAGAGTAVVAGAGAGAKAVGATAGGGRETRLRRAAAAKPAAPAPPAGTALPSSLFNSPEKVPATSVAAAEGGTQEAGGNTVEAGRRSRKPALPAAALAPRGSRLASSRAPAKASAAEGPAEDAAAPLSPLAEGPAASGAGTAAAKRRRENAAAAPSSTAGGGAEDGRGRNAKALRVDQLQQQRELDALRAQVEELQAQNRKLQDDAAQNAQHVRELDKELKQKATEAKEAQKQHKQLEAALEKKGKELEVAERKRKHLADELMSLVDSVAGWAQEDEARLKARQAQLDQARKSAQLAMK